MNLNKMQLAAVGIVAAVATIIGCVGTWATFQAISWSGTDANRGKTAAIAAGVALLLLALAAWRDQTWAAVVATLAGILSAAFIIWTLADIKGFVGASADQSIG